MTAIAVRPATLDDAEFLLESNLAMAWETEGKVLDGATLALGVRAVFEDARRGSYLLAERDGVAVGCLLVTFEWSDWRNGDFWWIQSVYVRPEARRNGVFQALYADVEARAIAANAVGLRLYVELENFAAQATYEARGMQRCHYFMYERSLVD